MHKKPQNVGGSPPDGSLGVLGLFLNLKAIVLNPAWSMWYSLGRVVTIQNCVVYVNPQLNGFSCPGHSQPAYSTGHCWHRLAVSSILDCPGAASFLCRRVERDTAVFCNTLQRTYFCSLGTCKNSLDSLACSLLICLLEVIMSEY